MGKEIKGDGQDGTNVTGKDWILKSKKGRCAILGLRKSEGHRKGKGSKGMADG